MDKNMIKIDDLLRQRLGDAEEQERPGAWLHMRELLDQQMPVRGVPGGAFNWRRMFGYIGGLVLLAAVSVGGYQAMESFSSDNETMANASGSATKAPVTPANGLAGTAANTAIPEVNHTQGEQKDAPATEDVAANTIQNQAKTTGTNAANAAMAGKNGEMTKITADRQLNNTPKSARNNKAENSGTQLLASGNTIPSGKANGKQNTTGQSSPLVQSSANNTAGNTANNSKNPVAVNSGSKQPTATERQQAGNAAGSTNTAGKLQTGQMQQAVVNNRTEQEHDIKEIPYQKIERKETVDKNGLVSMDTIFNGEDVMKVKVPKDGEALAMNPTDENNAGSNMNPAAAAPTAKNETTEENAAMQKLGDHKVASKKMKNYNPHRFEEMVRNAKFRMGAVKFYPGVVGGINASLNGNFGAHLGAAGNLSLSERWSILAEAKFAFTFNNSKERMQDDYIKDVRFNNINGQAVYTYDSIEHYYNFTDYKSIEMPLLLTYSKDRYIFMLGGSFRYNFKISNLQEVEQRYLLETSPTSTSEPTFSTQKQILLTDFSSSLNISPVLGFGYQASPGWRLDLRVSKSVWNNTSTYGQKEISKRLYDMPQVQFNLTHRFRSTKPYKRAQ